MRATPPPVRRRRGRSLIIVVLALALVAVAGGAVHWWQTRPQGNPQAVEFATAPLSPELTGATVLALGEATHGNAEFQRLRLSLVQKLPEFRALVLEEGRCIQAGPPADLATEPGTYARLKRLQSLERELGAAAPAPGRCRRGGSRPCRRRGGGGRSWRTGAAPRPRPSAHRKAG